MLVGEAVEVRRKRLGLKAGMASGKPSVAIRLDLPDGKVVIAETSLALFLGAASALHTKFGGGSNGHH